MAYKIFIDTNVFLDAFLERTPHWKDAEIIMKLAESKQLDLFTSANNLVNTMYVLRRQQLATTQIIQILELILSYTQLSYTSNQSFKSALQAGFNDLEDAIQYYTALDAGSIHYFITSDIKDYKKASIELPALTPKQFIVIYKTN
ncbi:MAG: type II toxin-antitoxin system VapC family toxin [Segetibacter sp.]